MIRPLVKIHGGKGRLANSFIIPQLPSGYEQMTYCESFCGMASVFLNKKSSTIEVLNDYNFDTHNLLDICKDEPQFLYDRLSKLSYNEKTFLEYKNSSDLGWNYNLGIREYVIRRMSRGGLGKTFAWSDRLRGGRLGDLNAWQTGLENIWRVSKRLKDVKLYCQSFETFIPLFDSPQTIFYCDPPYLHETRTAKKVYINEMDKSAHITLLDLLVSCKGKALVSGYRSQLYDDALRHWNRVEKQVKNNSGQNKKKQERIEVLWKNY